MTKFVNMLEQIVRGAGVLGAIIVLPLVVIMVWEVFVRYALNSPTLWAFEVSYMLMGTSFVLGIGYTFQLHGHVRVDFFYGYVSNRGRAIIDLIAYVVMLVFTIWLLFGLWDHLIYAIKHGETSGESAWNPVVWPFRTIFILGFAVFLLQLIAETIKCIYVISGRHPPGCIPENMKVGI